MMYRTACIEADVLFASRAVLHAQLSCTSLRCNLHNFIRFARDVPRGGEGGRKVWHGLNGINSEC